jgi:hypothetical protein
MTGLLFSYEHWHEPVFITIPVFSSSAKMGGLAASAIDPFVLLIFTFEGLPRTETGYFTWNRSNDQKVRQSTSTPHLRHQGVVALCRFK